MSAFSSSGTLFDYADKKRRLEAHEKDMARAGFWDHLDKAQETVAEVKSLQSVLKPLEELIAVGEDLHAMQELAEEDEQLAAELSAEVHRAEELVEAMEIKSLLDGPHDSAGAIVTLNARDGGTDANDWAAMLLRMYTLWAQKNGYSLELLDQQENDEAGINSATVAVRGPMAYGYLKGETGMHRLVRISPFNSEGKRQTSFAAVDVTPEITDADEIEIRPEDVREDTFRASGAGGQHVNKTDSAIRLTHVPTGIVVQCQNERSQHKNRATAHKMLHARLARLEEEKREAEQAKKHQTRAKTGFGAQIRNYFLHPDQRVKDARTGQLKTNFQDVLDGNIQEFLEAFLRWKVGRDDKP